MTLTKEVQQDKETLKCTGKWHKIDKTPEKAATNPGFTGNNTERQLTRKANNQFARRNRQARSKKTEKLNLYFHLD